MTPAYLSLLRHISAASLVLCGLINLRAAAPPLDSDLTRTELILNEAEYLEMPGLNVMLAHDFYPEGHQGGVGIILNDQRVATNGDLRLEPTPGQWEAVPQVGKRQIDRTT